MISSGICAAASGLGAALARTVSSSKGIESAKQSRTRIFMTCRVRRRLCRQYRNNAKATQSFNLHRTCDRSMTAAAAKSRHPRRQRRYRRDRIERTLPVRHQFPSRPPCAKSPARSRLPALVRRSELQEIAMPDKNAPTSRFQYSLSNLKPVEPVHKIALTFPDGARREFPKSTTGLDIAKGISPSLAKRTGAMALDGEGRDLPDPIEHDAKIEFIGRDDRRALELIRHDAAHVLAEAVQSLWPGTQVTIGPVIENGFYYDFFRNEPFTPEDFAGIEKKMREIIARDKPFTKEVWDREKTKQVFRDKGEAFKVELVDAIPEDQELKIYKQGDWFDLCRGPHMTSTGKVGNAFKLMKVAGAYWRGDSNNPMLTRIYGTAFAKQEELDAYLKQIEEAEKRDHRKLGRELDLFHFQEEGPGVVFWHPKGWTIFQALIAYMRRRLTGDYSEVNAPQILDKGLWETSGHLDWYRENMFAAQSAGDEAEDKRWFALKPMNCPGHVQIFKHGLKSYRDLPLRLAEFGVVHRYEPSGAMHGLMRVRGFTQDDAHVFCTEQQLADECLKINDLILSTYADFGFEGELTVKLSTRPEKRVGTDEMWDRAERVMATVLSQIEAQGHNHRIKVAINPGEG